MKSNNIKNEINFKSKLQKSKLQQLHYKVNIFNKFKLNLYMKFFSWNINGIRAALKKGFWDKVIELDPDFLCLQEIKCDDNAMSELFFTNQSLLGENSNGNENLHNDYSIIWHSCSAKKGYSGTAIIYKTKILENWIIEGEFKNLKNDKFDVEGRLIGMFLKHKSKGYKLFLLCGYYPQGGRDGRIPYKLEFYKEVENKLQEIQSQGYNIVITGDFNTTFTDIDLARPKENRKTTGCLPEEREVLNNLIDINHLYDSFRFLNPDLADQYTYWDQITRSRDRNVGWRIDMFFVDEKLKQSMQNAKIHQNVMGSDHCPIEVELNF
jgi:exodeoxyribonuclease III